jgi:hypothetical protein
MKKKDFGINFVVIKYVNSTIIEIKLIQAKSNLIESNHFKSKQIISDYITPYHIITNEISRSQQIKLNQIESKVRIKKIQQFSIKSQMTFKNKALQSKKKKLYNLIYHSHYSNYK